MPLNWSDFSGDSGTPDVPLLLSVRSQSLALSAIYYIQFAYRWGNPDATEWDEIEGAISECLNELMELQMPDFTPVGMVAWFPVITADLPEKWLKCDGSAVSQLTYPDLYLMLRNTFGSSGGMFNLPNLSAVFLYGAGIDNNIGDIGGEAVHTLTVAELPAHNHIQRGKNTIGGSVFHSQVNATSTAGGSVATTTPTSDTGADGAHNNMPPFMRGYWCIKALP